MTAQIIRLADRRARSAARPAPTNDELVAAWMAAVANLTAANMAIWLRMMGGGR